MVALNANLSSPMQVRKQLTNANQQLPVYLPSAGQFRPRKISSTTLEQFEPLKDDRKVSLSSAIQKTKDGLANPFGCDEQSPEDLIYNLFKIPNKSDASIGKLIMVLKNYGLQENDPRLAPMMRKIREIESEKEERMNEARDPKHWKLSQNDFKRVIGESLALIVQTLQNDLIVPAWGHFTSIIRDIYQECTPITAGKVADYIPQLARVNPNYWGVSICTVDGQRVSFGDSSIPFCVQSVSKAFNYSIAASELGAEKVHQFVGQEPSGRFFNEICLDPNNKPHNPMVNSGAIVVTSLIQNQLNMADRFEHMINEYKKIAGGEYVGFNNAVFLSEAATADRNFALAYFMKEMGCFPSETRNTSLKETLDFYFQLCSMEVTCEGAAVMAATLANGGVCPLTGERCIGSRPCRDVLSLMNSCGMYDYSGQFAFHVGLPAKSGVSGIMIVVVPNLMGIALWSPPLDRMGNSCRGVEFCKKLIQRFNFHNYDSLAHNESQKFDPRRRVGEREKTAVVSLLFAAKAGDLNTVRRMYMQGADLEMADYDKRTALHLAASEGHFDVALFLLETGKVEPDPRDRWNRTPLDDAREARHTSVALLLERRSQELQHPSTAPPAKPLHRARKSSSMQGLSRMHRNNSVESQLSIQTAPEYRTNGHVRNHSEGDAEFENAQQKQQTDKQKPSPLSYNGFSTAVQQHTDSTEMTDSPPNGLNSGHPFREPVHDHDLNHRQRTAGDLLRTGGAPNGDAASEENAYRRQNQWQNGGEEPQQVSDSREPFDKPYFYVDVGLKEQQEEGQNGNGGEREIGDSASSVSPVSVETREERAISDGQRFWEMERERQLDYEHNDNNEDEDYNDELSSDTGEEEDILTNDGRNGSMVIREQRHGQQQQQNGVRGTLARPPSNQRIEQLKQNNL